ncbi:hypothetical protein NDU88_003550 [Pleurodeles waltl]|uniref:Uncharacterized protein n=1 Tax=Pleurodeles waltl TaxID=8319 RepID=A0AAV7T6T1_PLEWA|nr:hypothetical protein NDU88_003550 [Pleurodeles waltl]
MLSTICRELMRYTVDRIAACLTSHERWDHSGPLLESAQRTRCFSRCRVVGWSSLERGAGTPLPDPWWKGGRVPGCASPALFSLSRWSSREGTL